jgi:hypothetical protein
MRTLLVLWSRQPLFASFFRSQFLLVGRYGSWMCQMHSCMES